MSLRREQEMAASSSDPYSTNKPIPQEEEERKNKPQEDKDQTEPLKESETSNLEMRIHPIEAQQREEKGEMTQLQQKIKNMSLTQLIQTYRKLKKKKQDTKPYYVELKQRERELEKRERELNNFGEQPRISAIKTILLILVNWVFCCLAIVYASWNGSCLPFEDGRTEPSCGKTQGMSFGGKVAIVTIISILCISILLLRIWWCRIEGQIGRVANDN